MIESQFLAENDGLLPTLKSIPIFEPFRDEDLRCLLRRSKIRKFRPQEFILHEGRRDTWIYFLVYGEVAISKAGRRFLTVHRRGELLGEMGAFDNAPRSASVQATTDTVCLATDVRLVESLPGTERMAFGYVLYRIVAAILAERLRETTRVLMGGQPRRRRNPLRWLIALSGRG